MQNAFAADKLRHVTFTDPRRSRRGPINFAPRFSIAGQSHLPIDLPSEDSALIRWILNQSSLNSMHYRPESLRRRLPAMLRILRAHSLSHAKSILQQNPALIPVALDSLVIGVTSFFRDPQTFHSLDQQVLSDICPQSSLRIWSAGCSDGAELYSIAMLLAQRNVLHRSTLIGTDCRQDAIDTAVAGEYDPSVLTHLPPTLRDGYMTESNARWSIRGWLRTIPSWRVANALRNIEPGQWDLISCRNMAMYLMPSAAALLWQRFEQVLRPGGYLFVGRAEVPFGTSRLTAISPCIYRRTKG